MKIRNGFVSNSSSSSFCILGIEIDENEYENQNIRKIKLPDGFSTRYGISDIEGVVVGILPSEINDDETIGSVKKLIANTLTELGIKTITEKDVDWIEDCGYNG
jgi:hypothetical protein